MAEFCNVRIESGITVITINRPEVMNSLHPPANAEMARSSRSRRAVLAGSRAISPGASR